MPRVDGVRERWDTIWYDTGFIEPGQGAVSKEDIWPKPVKLFGKKNIGDPHKTNLQVAEQLASDQSAIIQSIGVRLLGKTRAEEDLLLDHLHVTIVVGDHPLHQLLGPHASMLRHVYSKEELDRLEITADDCPVPEREGYRLKRPIVVPVRQCMHVDVRASERLPEAVEFRVYLFGVRSRDCG